MVILKKKNIYIYMYYLVKVKALSKEWLLHVDMGNTIHVLKPKAKPIVKTGE